MERKKWFEGLKKKGSYTKTFLLGGGGVKGLFEYNVFYCIIVFRWSLIFSIYKLKCKVSKCFYLLADFMFMGIKGLLVTSYLITCMYATTFLLRMFDLVSNIRFVLDSCSMSESIRHFCAHDMFTFLNIYLLSLQIFVAAMSSKGDSLIFTRFSLS